MADFVVMTVRKVRAKSAEAAADQARGSDKGRVVVQAAETLGRLTHPVHLQEAHDAFGDVGTGEG